MVLISVPPRVPFSEPRVIAVESDALAFTASSDLSRDDIEAALKTATNIVHRLRRINGRRPAAVTPFSAVAASPVGPAQGYRQGVRENGW